MLLDVDAWTAIVSSNVMDNSSPTPLSEEVLRSAYRFEMPCLSRHASPANRGLNCLASPRCFAGFHTLSTDSSALKECAAAIIGPGPQLLRDVTKDKATCKTLQMTRRGMRNLGNTCYLNAVLQMLFSVSGVRREILNASAAERPLHHIVDNESRDDTIQARADSTVCGALAESGLGELLAEMSLSRDAAGANTEPFASFLSLNPHIQQDAQEFFALLLNWLEREGGEAVHAAVREAFEGTLLYDRVCTACGRSFKRAEPFFFLSVPVRNSLEDALRAFLQSEEVHGFVCEECGVTTTASSMQYVRTLPDVLVIHLNRFTFDLQTLQRCKLTNTCSFPLEWDLSDLLHEWRRRDGAGAENTSNPDPGESLYTLCGVVNHLGETAVSGHYTYYGNVDGRAGWYLFDDSEVTKLQRFQGARGSSKHAYMLIYQRSTKLHVSRHVDHTSDFMLDSRVVDTVVLPPCLLQHVERLNNELERSFMQWERQRADIMLFLQRWSEVAGDLFGKISLPPNITVEGTIKNMEEWFALPSSWLRLLGRGFMPSYMELKRFGDKRKRRNRREGNTSVSRLSGPIEVDKSEEETEAGQDYSEGGAAAAIPIAGDEEDFSSRKQRAAAEAGAALTAAVSAAYGGPDYVLAGIRSRAAGIEEHSAAMLCPHGRLAPWAQFKLVPPAVVDKLTAFLQASCAAGADGTKGVEWDDAVLSKWRVRDNMCETCVTTLAAEVLWLKQSLDEEQAAQAMLRSADAATPADAVYVSAGVLNYWEDLIAVHSAWRDIVNRQGLTALHSVQRQCGYTQGKLQLYGHKKAMLPLPSAGELLCPHKLLPPLTTARAVPEELWRYLRDHVLLPACAEGQETFDSHALARVDEILPHLPVARTPKCPDCIQDTVTITAERHRARMAKIDEAKRFPTIAAAGLHLTAPMSLAEAQSQHPNRALWKRNLDRYFRDRRRVWEKSHAASIAEHEARLAALEAKDAAEREAEAQWAAMRTRRRGRQTQARALANAGEQQDRTIEREVPAPLREAREALTAARAAQCPESRVVYGCVPTWWVAAWRRWYTASDDNSIAAGANDHNENDGANSDKKKNNRDECSESVPPYFDLDAFRCPHGGTLVTASVLNPVDPFWESRAQAAHFTAFWRRRVGATKENGNGEEGADEEEGLGAKPPGTGSYPNKSGGDLHSNEAYLPPLVIVPMDEFIELAAAYGRPGMFLPRSPSSPTFPPSTSVTNATQLLDSGAVVFFVERDAERVMEPPTCQTCAAALLESVEEASHRFIGGSLRLQLHLRRSKRQFYDASDVLNDVHHTTTLRELRLAISQLVLERHGFILPLEEMEILRGRKALRSTKGKKIGSISVVNVDESQSPTQEEEGGRKGEGKEGEGKKEEEGKEKREDDDDDHCTLEGCGVCDGDVLTVNAIHHVLTAAAAAGPVDPELWQDIPAELLEPQESSHAFGATRLCEAGRGGKPKAATAAAETKAQVACDVCTFLNDAALFHCKMCDSLLPLPPS